MYIPCVGVGGRCLAAWRSCAHGACFAKNAPVSVWNAANLQPTAPVSARRVECAGTKTDSLGRRVHASAAGCLKRSGARTSVPASRAAGTLDLSCASCVPCIYMKCLLNLLIRRRPGVQNKLH